jgi:hypothetical protein
MEKSDVMQNKDPDSMKLLYKYQYAFLNMQKHYTCLIKIMKNLNMKALLKSIKHWKFLSGSSHFLAPQISSFKFGLKAINKKFNLLIKARQAKYLSSIISSSKIKEAYDIFLKNYKTEKEKSQKELKIMDSEVKSLKMNQAELEIITNYYAKSEGASKSRGKPINKGQAEKLINENADLERQIDELDKKTVEIFEELNLALDNYEQSKKSRGKKTKKKINGSLRKSFLPVTY